MAVPATGRSLCRVGRSMPGVSMKILQTHAKFIFMKIPVWLSGVFLVLQVDSIAQETWPMREWPVATPQSVSMNADSLQAFDNDIASGKYGNIDKVIITRMENCCIRNLMPVITIKFTVTA